MVIRNVTRALRLVRGRWCLLGRAAVELAIARIRLHADHSQHLIKSKATRQSPQAALRNDEAHFVEQVAFAIPRVARLLPWRADCLVQALAGKHWLRQCGIAAQVVIGVNKDSAAPLNAHAWLEVGDRIVTGGDIAAFVALTD